MSMGAALKAARVVDLATEVVAIEVLAACQAIDLLSPLTTSPPLARAHAAVRARVPVLTADRPPAPDFAAIRDLIVGEFLEGACGLQLE
jgi:histidine ammonia-lyase